MRPVNLIPEDSRRGTGRSGGALSYVVVGVLATVLVGVTVMVMLGNKVDDKQSQAEQLEAQAVEAEARAEGLAPYVSFAQMRQSRAATIDSLAKTRFDWERVIREVSVVLPKHVWLSNLTGTASPEVQVDDAAAIGLRTSVPGPALELVGCARSQTTIASLIAALHDIDGVTRVTAANGIKSDTAEDSGSARSADTEADTDGGCPKSAPGFQIVAAFDAVAAPDAEVPAPTVSTDTATAPTESTTTPTEQQAVAGASADTERATKLLPGG